VNGSISTDYPLTVNGKFAGRNIKGRSAAAGARSPRTVNGSIRMKKAVLAHFGPESADVDRLGEVAVEPGSQGFLSVARHGMGSQGDDLPGVVALQPFHIANTL